MTFNELKETWVDTPEFHELVKNSLTELVNSDEVLSEHRTFVENHVYGFGERPFWGMWKLLFGELVKEPKILEIGCFKGASLSVFKLLNPNCRVYGVTPLDSTGIDWEGDYALFIKNIHDLYKQEQPMIFHGLSENPEIIKQAEMVSPYDVVYIDGGHSREHIDNDLAYYAPMVKSGGYLVIDDACNDLNMPWGYFQGIQSVSDGVLAWEKTEEAEDFLFVFNVIHNRIYQRI